MKARKVIVTIELITDKSMKDLKAMYRFTLDDDVVKQVQVNVIQEKK